MIEWSLFLGTEWRRFTGSQDFLPVVPILCWKTSTNFTSKFSELKPTLNLSLHLVLKTDHLAFSCHVYVTVSKLAVWITDCLSIIITLPNSCNILLVIISPCTAVLSCAVYKYSSLSFTCHFALISLHWHRSADEAPKRSMYLTFNVQVSQRQLGDRPRVPRFNSQKKKKKIHHTVSPVFYLANLFHFLLLNLDFSFTYLISFFC